MPASPFTVATDGVRVAVRVAPGTAHNRIGGVSRGAEGGSALKVSVTAAPVGGKANAALIKLLSKTWRVPKGAITIAAGAGSRRKVVHVAGNPQDLLGRLRRSLDAGHG
ncbi:MAG: DUF167 domain-containing protein [Kiloniellales bacterium]